MKIRTSVTIDANVGLVFDAFRDLDSIADQVSGIEDIEILGGPAMLAVGTRWRETRRLFGRTATEEMWVTALTTPESYVVEASSNGTEYCTRYRFTALPGDQTRVDLAFTGIPVTRKARLLAITFALFAGAARKALRADMIDLKRTLEPARGSMRSPR